MAERTDWRVSSILQDAHKNFEEHSKRIGVILDEARERFKKDYTGYTAAFCMLLGGASTALAWFGTSPVVCTAGILVGGIGLISALILRHLNNNAQMEYMRGITELERERAKLAQRTATLQQIWLYGLPEGTPLAQIQMLLGDPPTTTTDSDAPLKWKALPGPGSGNNPNERGDTNSCA
jgi:hypothetical protein